MGAPQSAPYSQASSHPLPAESPCCGSITRGHPDLALPLAGWIGVTVMPQHAQGCSPCVEASFQAAPVLIDLDLQLGHRRLGGGSALAYPFPVPSLQTPIGSLPLTGSASKRAMPLGSWMSRQSRVGPMNSKV